MSQNGISLLALLPDPSDPKAVTVALFKARLHDGKFDVERVFDVLFSQNVHMHAMMRVGQKYGAPGMSAYHNVFAHLVADVGGDRAPIEADDHMDHMHIDGSSHETSSKRAFRKRQMKRIELLRLFGVVGAIAAIEQLVPSYAWGAAGPVEPATSGKSAC